MNAPTILVNGQAGDCLSTQDRGLLYGDGLFETMAVRHGVPQHWTRHVARLAAGCARLGIVPPDTGLLRAEAGYLCRDAAHAVLKLVVTRGTGGRGYRTEAGASPTRILQLHPYPSWPADHAHAGVAVRLCELRLGINPRLAGLKHLNRLEQVLARAEWDDPGIAEGLILDMHGHLVEGTMSNVFLVRDGTLLTPDLSHCGVAGIMRGRVLELAREAGTPTVVRTVAPEELEDADEVFLCNSLIGIWPVIRIAARGYPAGDMTRRLQHSLRAGADDER